MTVTLNKEVNFGIKCSNTMTRNIGASILYSIPISLAIQQIFNCEPHKKPDIRVTLSTCYC